MRRKHAEESQAGSLKDSGKRPLKFQQYIDLCSRSLRLLDTGFTHLFLILSWNLMCRSKSTESVQLDHFSHENDAIGCVFYKSKTDQAGDKRRDPKHLYANPNEPTACVFLALAIYLACNPQHGVSALFPGSNQRDRFSKSLARLANECQDGLSKNVGTHSIRKGAATYVIAGSTSGPSIVNVCIRCGWALGHVMERYLHYDGAGDQYVGRVVAGLPLSSSKFACLPPHFTKDSAGDIDPVIKIVFPCVWQRCPQLRGVLALCLASLAYHCDFLVSSLPLNHPLLSTPLFADVSMLARVRPFLTTSSTLLHPTGIPPHISIHARIEDIYQLLTAMPIEIKSLVESLFKDYGGSAGYLTRNVLEETLTNVLRSMNGANSSSSSRDSENENVAHQPTLYNWGGRWRRLPETFVLPAADLNTAWRLWWLGSSSSHSTPFRLIKTFDLTQKQAKLLSDWRKAMKSLIANVGEGQIHQLESKPSYQLVADVFSRAISSFSDCLSQTPLGRTRRVSQMKLTTFVRLTRDWTDSNST